MSTDDQNDDLDNEPLRPVAIAGSTGAWGVDAVEGEPVEEGGAPVPGGPIEGGPLEPSRYEPPPVESARDEILVGLSALVLAVSVFLPWYIQDSFFRPIRISGWASGTWGPVVFFIALAAMAIVGLRLARVPVTLPVAPGLMLEGMGWAAVVLILVKRFFIPNGFQIPPPWEFKSWFWLSLLAAVAIAMLASRLSKDTPVVVIPGWHRGRAGLIGVALLALIAVGGAAFGLTNDTGKARDAALKSNTTGTIDNPNIKTTKGFPECAKRSKLPIPEGVKPISGTESIGQTSLCTADLSSNLRLPEVVARYTRALREADWDFEVIKAPGPQAKVTRVIMLTGPACGQVAVTTPEGQKITAIKLFMSEQFCQAQRQFSPGATPSPNRSN